MNVFLNEAIANKYDSYYDTPIGSQIDRIEKESMANFLRVVPRQPVLELGCGTGHWSEFLSKSGFHVIATDISDAMLAIAQKKSIENVRFQKADASILPFDNESFETIVSITMLEFTGNVQKVLDEIYRVLKPNGNLVLGCLNINSELGKTKNNDETFRNAHFFSKDELKDVLSIFGNAEITECAFLTQTFEILDDTIGQYPVEGSFLAAYVRKIK
jgi:ubiquinone/menaquinone biosynthesis C-methylase UbiE